jgi:hypothetical protein
MNHSLGRIQDKTIDVDYDRSKSTLVYTPRVKVTASYERASAAFQPKDDGSALHPCKFPVSSARFRGANWPLTHALMHVIRSPRPEDPRLG